MTIQYVSGYKYQLFSDYGIVLNTEFPIQDTSYGYLTLRVGGLLTIEAGYAWDGPSGPTVDTSDSIRASLVHDALYQLIRVGHLPKSFRREADRIFREICLEAGMGRVRAYSWWAALRLFGSEAAELKAEPQIKEAP